MQYHSISSIQLMVTSSQWKWQQTTSWKWRVAWAGNSWQIPLHESDWRGLGALVISVEQWWELWTWQNWMLEVWLVVCCVANRFYLQRKERMASKTDENHVDLGNSLVTKLGCVVSRLVKARKVLML
jgi:hypothetical protein